MAKDAAEPFDQAEAARHVSDLVDLFFAEATRLGFNRGVTLAAIGVALHALTEGLDEAGVDRILAAMTRRVLAMHGFGQARSAVDPAATAAWHRRLDTLLARQTAKRRQRSTRH